MPSVHPTQLPGLVTDAGYAVMMETYAQQPNVRDQVFEVKTVTGSEYGMTEVVIVGADEPSEISYGAVAPARTLDQGYQWWCRTRKLGERVIITEEMMRDPNADAKIGGMIASLSRKYAEGFARKKESLAANIFNYGAFTAGHMETFDGSFPGHIDSYPKFIYDGKPLFAASGNGHPLFLNSSVTKVNFDTNALSSTNLEAARILMSRTNAVDEADQRITISPDTLLVPPELVQTAEVLVGSVQLPGTAQNDINTARGRFRVISWAALTDTDGWFLGEARKGIKLLDSGDPMLMTEPLNDGSGSVSVRWVSYFGAVATNWRSWSAHRSAQS